MDFNRQGNAKPSIRHITTLNFVMKLTGQLAKLKVFLKKQDLKQKHVISER